MNSQKKSAESAKICNWFLCFRSENPYHDFFSTLLYLFCSATGCISFDVMGLFVYTLISTVLGIESIKTFNQGKVVTFVNEVDRIKRISFFGDSVLRGVWLHTVQTFFKETTLKSSELNRCWGRAKVKGKFTHKTSTSIIELEYNDLRLDFRNDRDNFTVCHNAHIAKLPFYGTNLTNFLKSYSYKPRQTLFFKLPCNSLHAMREYFPFGQPNIESEVVFLLNFLPPWWNGKLLLTTNCDFNGFLSLKPRTPSQQAEVEDMYRNISRLDSRIHFMSLYPLAHQFQAPDGQHFHTFCDNLVCGNVTEKLAEYFFGGYNQGWKEESPPKRLYCATCPPSLVPFTIHNRDNFECSSALPPAKKHNVLDFTKCPCLGNAPTEKIRTQSGEVYGRKCT